MCKRLWRCFRNQAKSIMGEDISRVSLTFHNTVIEGNARYSATWAYHESILFMFSSFGSVRMCILARICRAIEHRSLKREFILREWFAWDKQWLKKWLLGGTIVVCLLTEILDKFYLTNCVYFCLCGFAFSPGNKSVIR